MEHLSSCRSHRRRQQQQRQVNGLVSAVLLLVVQLLQPAPVIGSSSDQRCYNGPAPVIVNPDADVYLGVLLNVHEMGDEIEGKCSTTLHREAVELYESLRWYLSFINQNSGQVASRLIKDSLIPGMKLGLKIFDACGDADLAERQLGALFPELLEDDDVAGGANCPQRQGLEEVSHGAMIGLLDFAGLTDEDPEIGEQLLSFSIPYMSVRLDDFLPADQVAEALVQFAKRMMWERVSVLYAGDDDYSMAITKAVSSNAHESGICFESYAEVGSDSELQGISQGTDDTGSPINNASVTAVLVIAPPEDAHNVTTWMQELQQQQHNKRNHRYQWLFAQPWAAESTDLLAQLSSQSDVYTLAVSPIIVDPFETYWNRRKTPSLAYTQENRWFLDYFSGMKRCRLPVLPDDDIDRDSTLPLCHNFNNLPESALDRVLRHSRVLPAVHVLNTFATAFRRARDAKCIRRNQRPPQSATETGYCSSLREMTRKEFIDEFFSKMEVHHGGPGSRVPTGFVGYKKSSSHKMEDVRFSLVRSSVDQVKELFSYQKASGVQSVDPTMSMKPDAQLSVRCPSRDGCSHCVFFQQPGAFYKSTPNRSPQSLPQSDQETSTSTLAKVLTAVAGAGQAFNASLSGSILNDDQSSLASSSTASDAAVSGKITDIVIPALFAVHKAGPNPSQCSAQVDPDAIQEVEAFLWALDLVNSNVELLKDVEIGAVIYDTCSSPAQAINIVSGILGDTNDTKEENKSEVDIKPDELLAVVSAATGDETEAAASILAASERSIATISAKERSDSRLTNPGHQLQVAVPMSLAARAVVDLIKYAGWTYVSVIYSGHDADAVSGLRHFQQLIENTQICTGVFERLNRTRGSPLALDPLFEHLTASRMMETGGRVVVLWTDESDTQAILAKLHLLSPVAAERYKQLVWISAAGWIGGGRVYNMVKDVGKWIVVRPLVPIVEEFAQHYARLRPENNERNPWYAEYWEQLNRECQEQPNHPDCPAAAVQQRIRPSTTNLIQTVFVIASALARIIEDDDCSSANKNNETALLCSSSNANATVANYREALIGYLQNTGTDRAGADGEFGFTDQGFGDTALEIAEVRGGFSDFTYHQMGVYDHEAGLHMASGEGLISVQSIVSECLNSNNGRKEICSAGCMTRQQNQMIMTASRDRLYVMGLFDVREPGTSGGSCSQNVSSQGLQQTEAFLWALEQVNQTPHLLPGVQLGAVALDGCGSNQKQTAEIDRFFTSTVVRSGIEDNRVVAMVLATPQELDQSVLSDLKENYTQLPVIVSSSVGPREATKTPSSSPLLQLSPSVPMTTRLIGDLLHSMNWTHVSSVCSSHLQFPTYGVICEEFQNSISQYGVSYAVDLVVDESASTTGADYWNEVASLVVAKAQEPDGARILIALLPDSQLIQLLTALSRLPIASQRSIVLITSLSCNSRDRSITDSKIQSASEALMAIILLRCQSPPSGTFFQDLESPNKFQLSSPNPWLSKYWTQTFQCRGITCKNKALDESGYRRDESVSNTINAVLAVAQALERVRQMLCPNVDSGVCSAMVAQRNLRPLVERALLDSSFMDIGGRLGDFDPDSGVSKDANIEVVCMYSHRPERAETIVAGTFSLRRGLVLDRSKFKAVNVEGRSILLQSVVSRCVNCNEQQTTKIPSTQTLQPEQQQWNPSQYMQIKPKISPGFSLVGMLPFHRQGLKPLTCGPMHSGRMFQNLAAVAFLFERVQQQQQLHFSGNGTVHQIGAVFLDSCGRVERAQQRLLSFISDNNTPIWSPNIIGAVTLDGETAQAVSNVLGEANIPQITVAIDGHRSTNHVTHHHGVGDDNIKWHSLGAGGQTFQSVPTAEDEVKALFDIVHDLAWKHVVLFYDDSQSGVADRDLFIQHVRRHRAGDDGQLHGICLGAQIRVNKFGQSDVLDLHAQLQTIASDLPTLSVAVLLLENPAQVQHVLLVLEDVGLSKRFIVLANHAWGANHRDIMFQSASHQLAGVLTVSMESYPVPGFGQFLAGLTLQNHSTIPDDWFQEYFQHHFQCHLVGSKVIQRMYPKQCTGTETITLMDDSEQDPYVYHTLAALETYFKALHHFLQLYCPTLRDGEKQPSQLSDCGPSALERFNAVLNDMVNQREPSPIASPPLLSLIPARRAYRGVVVWNAQYHADKPASYERVGFWRPHQQQQENSVGNWLELDRSRMKFYVPYSAVPSVECLTGACLSICSAQYSPIVTHSTNRNRGSATPGTNIKLAGPELPTNFSTAWGVVAVVFCILGLLGCMACVSYFIRNLSRPSTPTSVLAYLILSGIALLYITTIFFLIQPSEISCGLRRFFLGLSYSIIYSGLLVKAVHSWRRISRGGVQTLADRQNNQQQQPQQQTSIGSGSTGSLDMADVTKPPGLVFSTMALIAVQVILLSAWLIFKPPTAVPSPQQQLLTGLLWRCSPSDSFESELVISLILPIVLIFTAVLFSLVVWRSSDAPRDSRSIAACCCLLAFVTVIWTLVATQASFKFREPAIVIGNIICAKIILIILYGRKVYEISVMRQESRNLAILSQFTISKSLQPSLHNFATNRSPSGIYTTDLDIDLPTGITGESYVAGAEDPAMGLCLGLAGGVSRDGSRRSSRVLDEAGNPLQPTSSYLHRQRGEMLNDQIVPYPVYPPQCLSTNSDRTSACSRSVEGDRDLSDSDDIKNSRYRTYSSHPTSRRSSVDLSPDGTASSAAGNQQQRPALMVRRVGSRQMLVLGDEASIHGRVSKI